MCVACWIGFVSCPLNKCNPKSNVKLKYKWCNILDGFNFDTNQNLFLLILVLEFIKVRTGIEWISFDTNLFPLWRHLRVDTMCCSVVLCPQHQMLSWKTAYRNAPHSNIQFYKKKKCCHWDSYTKVYSAHPQHAEYVRIFCYLSCMGRVNIGRRKQMKSDTFQNNYNFL